MSTSTVLSSRHASIRRLSATFGFVLLVALLEGCASAPPPTDVELGEQALARGDWRQARSHFAIALKRDPHSGRAWLGQARSQVAGRDPESALRSFGSLAKIDVARFKGEAQPDYADALHAAARGRLDQKKSQAALVAVRALAKLDPKRAGLGRLVGDALVAEAYRLRLQGDRDAAYGLFHESVRSVPNRLEGWLGCAEILIESNRGKEAVQLLEAARRYHPTAGEIRMLSIQALGSR